MGYLLRMSDEIHDWLTDLHRSDPPTAMSVARALTALMSEGASLGPPLVIPVADSAPPEDLMAALDSSYEDRLERLKAVRRRVAETAMLVRDLQDRLAELESAQSPESTEAALVDRNRTRTLAEQRTRLGFTQAEVAHRMGVRQERVSAIERAEPDATEVRTLASYIEALGGRLELIADFSGDRVPLR